MAVLNATSTHQARRHQQRPHHRRSGAVAGGERAPERPGHGGHQRRDAECDAGPGGRRDRVAADELQHEQRDERRDEVPGGVVGGGHDEQGLEVALFEGALCGRLGRRSTTPHAQAHHAIDALPSGSCTATSPRGISETLPRWVAGSTCAPLEKRYNCWHGRHGRRRSRAPGSQAQSCLLPSRGWVALMRQNLRRPASRRERRGD